MAYNYRIEFHSLQKREKSTKNPSDNGYRVDDVILKNGSSLFTPTLTLKLADKTSVSLSEYNCFYLFEYVNNLYRPILGLYKITNIESVGYNTWTISGEIDYLSSTASQIKSSSQYVTRISLPSSGEGQSRVEGYDDRQYDSLCDPTTEIVTHNRYQLSSGFSTSSSNSMTVVGFVGRNMEFYASTVSPQGIANSAINNQDIIDLVEDNLGRYNDYFSLSKIFPFCKNSVRDKPDSVTWIGTKQTVCAHGFQIDVKDISGVDGVTEASRIEEIIATSGEGPAARDGIACVMLDTEYRDFRRYDNRFTKIVANCPFVGMIEIDPIFLNYESLNFSYKIDILTGDAELSVYAQIGGTNKQIGNYACKIGIDVPIANYETNWTQIATQLYEQNWKASAQNLFAPPTTKHTLSNLSGFASSLISTIYIDVLQYKSTEIGYTNFKGRPCNKLLNLGSLPSGTYVECLNPDLNIIKQDYIREQVINALASGIYLE